MFVIASCTKSGSEKEGQRERERKRKGRAIYKEKGKGEEWALFILVRKGVLWWHASISISHSLYECVRLLQDSKHSIKRFRFLSLLNSSSSPFFYALLFFSIYRSMVVKYSFFSNIIITAIIIWDNYIYIWSSIHLLFFFSLSSSSPSLELRIVIFSFLFFLKELDFFFLRYIPWFFFSLLPSSRLEFNSFLFVCLRRLRCAASEVERTVLPVSKKGKKNMQLFLFVFMISALLCMISLSSFFQRW